MEHFEIQKGSTVKSPVVFLCFDKRCWMLYDLMSLCRLSRLDDFADELHLLGYFSMAVCYMVNCCSSDFPPFVSPSSLSPTTL